MRVRLAGAVFLAALTGCAPASPGGAGPVPASANGGFQREITPFPVLDAAGAAYEHAFLGGLDVPRPQLVDLDGDGDPDLFVQERTGELIYFENVGTPTSHRFVWRTDRYQDLDVGEWARFHDLDGDGDLDLLAETPYSYIRLFRNDGTATAPRFQRVADSLRSESGRPIFSDRQNIPALADVDCNGRVDLFLGRVDGTVSRYQETRVDDDGVPVFTLVAERFEDIEIVAQIAVPGGNDGARPTRHGANSMTFGDVDGDGDPDLLWGDYFEPGLLLIENHGTCPRPNLRSEPVPVPAVETILTSGYNAPFLVDLDADGDLDLFIGVLGGAFNANLTAADNLHHYERLDDGRVALRTTRFLNGVDLGSESAPALADLDGDGDLDLLVGNKLDPATPTTARLYRFENTGTETDPRFQLADTTSLLQGYHYAPALADLDGDGVAELLLGSWNEGVFLYRNEGGGGPPRWVAVSDSALVRPPRGSHSVPAAGDVDGDGLVDLLVGESSGEINYFRNVGTPTAPRFELVTEALGGLDAGRRSAPTLVDLDGDGRLDLVVGREEGGVLAFLNAGVTDGVPRFVPAPASALPLDGDMPRLGQPAFADLDGDGDLDLVAGGAGGGVVFFRNHRPR